MWAVPQPRGESGTAARARPTLLRSRARIAALAFGTDCNTVEDEGDVIQHYLDKIFPVRARRTLAPFRYWRWLRWAGNRQVGVPMEWLMEVASDAIELAGGHGVGQQRRGRRFMNDEIAGNVLIMFLAGEDTTANTLAWMMHLMAEHPEGQCQT